MQLKQQLSPSKVRALLDECIKKIPISKKAYLILKVMEVKTLRDLQQFDAKDLERFSSTSKAIEEVMDLITLVHESNSVSITN